MVANSSALEQCPHGYVISDTTHQCPKCGPVESPTSKTVSDDALRLLWQANGGRFHGPNVETGTMPEAKLLPFLRSIVLNQRAPVETSCVDFAAELLALLNSMTDDYELPASAVERANRALAAVKTSGGGA